MGFYLNKLIFFQAVATTNSILSNEDFRISDVSRRGLQY